MNNFPALGLLNKFHIGDDVLLEPIADALAEREATDVYVISQYPELFENHPRIVGLHIDGAWPVNMRIIDLTESIQSMETIIHKGKKQKALVPNKVLRMWEQAGLCAEEMQSPRLYLSEEERVKANELRRFFGEKCAGVVLRSRYAVKDWPYTRWLIRYLRRHGYDVFAIGESLRRSDNYLSRYGVHRIVGESWRDLMMKLSMLDVVITPDTGPGHIAAAMGVPTVVLTRQFWADIWQLYDKCNVVATPYMRKYSMYSIGPGKVNRAVEPAMHAVSTSVRKRGDSVALFRLDGLGGSITLTDQAKKIYEKTGRKSVLIVRNYKDAFAGNPYVDDVVEVGNQPWLECLPEMTDRFETLAEIRFAPGKWHQSGRQFFQQDFGRWKDAFANFPMYLNELETEGIHQVQITDRSLGLPDDSIEMDVYNWGELPDLPGGYVALSNGVDTLHRGMKQTKTWDKWAELVGLMDLPFVQTGTAHDPVIDGAIDMRGKTTIPEYLTLLRDAAAVVCTEGGTMHCAYATGAKNVVVVRGPTRGKLFEYPGHRCVDSYICYNCVGETGDWYVNCAEGVNAACMDSISAERVAYNLEESLNEAVA